MTRIITNGFPTRGLWRIHHNLRVPSCPFVVHGSRNTRGMTNDQCLRLCPTAFSPSPTAFSASPTDFRSRPPAFSASPTASFIPAQGKAALAAAALGLVRKRSTQPEGLPHPPPQTPRSIVNQRGFSIRCSLLGGPHQPLLSPAVADLRGSQISSMEDLNMSTQLRTVIVRPDQLSQEEKNRLRPQVPIE